MGNDGGDGGRVAGRVLFLPPRDSYPGNLGIGLGVLTILIHPGGIPVEASLPSRSLNGSTSSSLIQRVRAQYDDAWAKLVRLRGPLVDFGLKREGLNGAEGEDVFQEVIAGSWTSQVAYLQ